MCKLTAACQCSRCACTACTIYHGLRSCHTEKALFLPQQSQLSQHHVGVVLLGNEPACLVFRTLTSDWSEEERKACSLKAFTLADEIAMMLADNGQYYMEPRDYANDFRSCFDFSRTSASREYHNR